MSREPTTSDPVRMFVPPTVVEAMRLADEWKSAASFYGELDWHTQEAKVALETYLIQLHEEYVRRGDLIATLGVQLCKQQGEINRLDELLQPTEPAMNEEVEVMIKKLVSEQDDVSYREVAALLRKQAARIVGLEADGLLRAAEICMTHMRLMEPDERKERDALGHLRQDLLKEAAAVQPTLEAFVAAQKSLPPDVQKIINEKMSSLLDGPPVQPTEPTWNAELRSRPPVTDEEIEALCKDLAEFCSRTCDDAIVLIRRRLAAQVQPTEPFAYFRFERGAWHEVKRDEINAVDVVPMYTHSPVQPTEPVPLAHQLFNSRYAEAAIQNALEELWGDDAILGISWDDYDGSLEVYVMEATVTLVITAENIAVIKSMGFERFWVNYPDGTEQYNDGPRKPYPEGHNNWAAFNNGRKNDREHSPVQPTEPEDMRQTFETWAGEQMLMDSDDLAWEAERNCYRHPRTHQMWQAYRAAARAHPPVQPTEPLAFDDWWCASKYCQVVNPQAHWRQIALDGWNAAHPPVQPTEPSLGELARLAHEEAMLAGDRELSIEEINSPVQATEPVARSCKYKGRTLCPVCGSAPAPITA